MYEVCCSDLTVFVVSTFSPYAVVVVVVVVSSDLYLQRIQFHSRFAVDFVSCWYICILYCRWFEAPRGSEVAPQWSDEMFALLNTSLMFLLGVVVFQASQWVKSSSQVKSSQVKSMVEIPVPNPFKPKS